MSTAPSSKSPAESTQAPAPVSPPLPPSPLSSSTTAAPQSAAASDELAKTALSAQTKAHFLARIVGLTDHLSSRPSLQRADLRDVLKDALVLLHEVVRLARFD